MSHADIFSLSLYSACGGLPLWVPHPSLRLGDVGFLREGQFHVLFNVRDGPPHNLGDASSNALAKRTQASFKDPSRSPSSRSPSRSPAPPEVDMDAPTPPAQHPDTTISHDQDVNPTGLPGTHSASSSVLPDSRRSSLTSSALPGSRRASLANRLLIPSDEVLPPAPLEVDEDSPLVFDMGPRTSNNYRCLGFNVGASVTGAPAGGTVSFETSGGDGALLMPRDPTERSSLKHIGVLKTYVKTHRKWIFEQYGRPEDMDLNEITLVYGQDRTSDWAVAVSRDMARGAKVDLQIFGFGQAGVWCEWKTACTASQRGPHRDQSQYVALQQAATAKPSPSTQPATAAHKCPTGFGFSVNAAAPMDVDVNDSNIGSEEGGNGLQFGISATAGSAQSQGSDAHGPTVPETNWTWAEHNPFPPTETIVIRRITAQHRLGLGFLPTKMQASAGPRKDGTQGPDEADTRVIAGATSDPLSHLHAFIQSIAPSAHTSIASDTDCAVLLRDAVWDTDEELRDSVYERATESARVDCDEDGFATVRVDNVALESSTPTSSSTPVSLVSSAADMQNWAYAASLPATLDVDAGSQSGSYGHASDSGLPLTLQRSFYLSSKLRKARSHRLCVLSRERLDASTERIIVFGKSGRPFTVLVSSRPSCDCPESRGGRFTCAHILYVFSKVLKVSERDDRLFQKIFTPDQIERIFRDAPVVPGPVHIMDAAAASSGSSSSGRRREASSSSTSSWKERMRSAASYASNAIRSSPKKAPKSRISPSYPVPPVVESRVDMSCPICYDDLDTSSPDVVRCTSSSCGRPAHASCFSVLHSACALQGYAVACVCCGEVQHGFEAVPPGFKQTDGHAKEMSDTSIASNTTTTTASGSAGDWPAGTDTLDRESGIASCATGRRGSAATETTITSLSSSHAGSSDSNLTALGPDGSGMSTPVLRAGISPRGVKRGWGEATTGAWSYTEWLLLSSRGGMQVPLLS